MDIIITFSDGSTKNFNIFLSKVDLLNKNFCALKVLYYQASGILKPIVTYLMDNSELKISHLTINFNGSTLMNADITDYLYDVHYVFDSGLFLETLFFAIK